LDNLTHSLLGLTLANAGLRRAGRGATAALVIASNIPDLEVVTRFTAGRVGYLEAHRGPSHGPAALLLAAATAALVWAATRLADRWTGAGPQGSGRSPSAPATFLALLGVAAIGVAGHVSMDFATSYGTRVLSPFAPTWFGVDWMPIVDVFLLAVLLAGAGWAWLRPALAARVAAAVLVALAADYACRAALHEWAITRAMELCAAQAQGVAVPARPPTVFAYHGRSRPAALPAALPTLSSPFAWRLVVPSRGGFLVTEVDIRDRSSGWTSRAAEAGIWFPNDTGPFVEQAASSRMGDAFLTFSRFPSAEIVTHANGDLTVHWYELRFAEHRAPVGNDRRRHTSPFGAWVRLTPNGGVIGQGLGPG
jgi:hypothetical protein